MVSVVCDDVRPLGEVLRGGAPVSVPGMPWPRSFPGSGGSLCPRRRWGTRHGRGQVLSSMIRS
jgi:hypothetical protein